MKNFKPYFTINNIGKFYFYSGILLGIGYSFIFNLLFRIILKISNLGMDIDKWGLEYKISTFYYVLIGFTSIGFAFCFTTYLWMSKPFASQKKKTLKLRMSQTNTFWILFGTLLFLSRIFWSLMGINMTIERDFSFLSFMIPIFIYLYCWHLISMIYQSKKPFLICSLLVIIGGFILSCI